ncbi:hypothetical protein AAG906_018941 [Vitis piasezkii]
MGFENPISPKWPAQNTNSGTWRRHPFTSTEKNSNYLNTLKSQMQNPIWASNPLESPFLGYPCSKLVFQSTRRLTRRRRKGGERGREWAVRAMPCSSKNTSSSSRDDNDALRAFKLSESTFLASLMPKKGIAADRFVEGHSKYDARGVVVAIFDSGVLQLTSYLSSGSGDIDTSTVVKADSEGCLGGASGASLVVNSSWKNPSGEWHSYDDKGPIIDAVVWNGEPWRATLDRQSLEDDPGCGKLADFVTVTNYRSCKIGGTCLGSTETGTGLTRSLIAAVKHKCDLVNMTLTAVGSPGGTTSLIVGVGAYVLSPAMAAGARCVVGPPSEGLEYSWSSHEPTVDGDLGVCISPPRKFDFASALCITICYADGPHCLRKQVFLVAY